MLSPKRLSLLLAITFLVSLVAVIATTLSRGQTIVSANQRIKVLRRKDQLHVKPTADEIASAKNQLPKEERELEDKLPKHLPIKVRIRPEKEKAFKDIDNDNWARDLEVEVRNTGTRPIYYLVLIVDMPELKFGESNMIYSLRFGEKKFMNFASGAKPEDLSLKPGETCILDTRTPLDWNEYSRDMNWPRPKQFVLKFQEISFGDGTGFRSSYDGPWPSTTLRTITFAMLES